MEASEAEGLGDGGWGEGQVLKLDISMLVYKEGSPLLHEFAVPIEVDTPEPLFLEAPSWVSEPDSTKRVAQCR